MFMQEKGFIDGEEITEIGKQNRLIVKKYMGNKYIVYPENLPILHELKNKNSH